MELSGTNHLIFLSIKLSLYYCDYDPHNNPN